MTIRKILVAHDFSEAATRAVKFAHGLTQSINAALEIVHVYIDIYEDPGDRTLTLPHALPGQSDRYLRFLEDELSKLTGHALGDKGLAIPCHVVRGDPLKRINDVVRDSKSDLLCIGATGKGAVQRAVFGSVSQLLLRRATVPVLVVP